MPTNLDVAPTTEREAIARLTLRRLMLVLDTCRPEAAAKVCTAPEHTRKAIVRLRAWLDAYERALTPPAGR
jgi:hypothetical protein